MIAALNLTIDTGTSIAHDFSNFIFRSSNIITILDIEISYSNSFPVFFFQISLLEHQTNQHADDIYEILGRSINQLVKYFDEPEKKVFLY